jgi:hypothetical protein
MEGYLKKWTNMIHRWKPRYFKLEKGILRYRKYRFTEVKGEIDLKQCQIVVTPKDNLRIVIKFANKKRKPV